MPDFAALGVFDVEVDVDVGEAAGEDPVVAGEAAGVEDFDEELDVGVGEEGGVAGVAGEGPLFGDPGAALEVFEGGVDAEAAVVEAHGIGVWEARADDGGNLDLFDERGAVGRQLVGADELGGGQLGAVAAGALGEEGCGSEDGGGGVAQGVEDGSRLAGLGVGDGDGVLDVREVGVEDPEVAGEAAGVEDFDEDFGIGGAEEGEVAGFVGEAVGGAGSGVALEVAPGDFDPEPLIVEAELGGSAVGGALYGAGPGVGGDRGVGVEDDGSGVADLGAVGGV